MADNDDKAHIFLLFIKMNKKKWLERQQQAQRMKEYRLTRNIQKVWLFHVVIDGLVYNASCDWLVQLSAGRYQLVQSDTILNFCVKYLSQLASVIPVSCLSHKQLQNSYFKLHI